jgi:hypothetical protein
MSVNIVWSFSNGGAALSSAIDHGSSPNGDTTTAQLIYLRHDGSNEITAAKIYAQQFTGSYVGAATAAADISEVLSWGDASTESTFGGIHFNLNAIGSFPTAAWPTYDDKTPTGGATCRTGVGDSGANGVTIPTTAGASSAGVIQTGTTPNVRFQARIQVPSTEDTVGIRQFDFALSYSFTS